MRTFSMIAGMICFLLTAGAIEAGDWLLAGVLTGIGAAAFLPFPFED